MPETKKIDWSVACFPLGVHVPNNPEKPWLELTADELKVLRLLLTRLIPTAAGEHAPAAAEWSGNLKQLAEWAQQAEAYLRPLEEGRVKS